MGTRYPGLKPWAILFWPFGRHNVCSVLAFRAMQMSKLQGTPLAYRFRKLCPGPRSDAESESNAHFRAMEKRLVNDTIALCQCQQFLSLAGPSVGVQGNGKPDLFEAYRDIPGNA